MLEFAGIHLLRPWFLLVIPIGLTLVWLLQRHSSADERRVDPELRDYALIGRNTRARQLRGLLLVLIVLLAGTSLAGPGWKYIELPAQRSTSPTFILLDLSYSMAATDLQPSRYKRAVFAIRDLLHNNPNSAPFALIAYSGEAYQVAPLSYDLATINNFLDALDPRLLPADGSNPVSALKLVANTIAATESKGTATLVLLSDDLSAQSEEIIQLVRNNGWRLMLIAVGQNASAPIAGPDGKLLRQGNGQLRLADYNPDSFRYIARALSAQLASIDGRLGRITEMQLKPTDTTEQSIQRRQPADLGYLFALPLLPLFLLTARRGVWGFALLLLVFATPRPAMALSWSDLWQSSRNQASQALLEGEFKRAQKLSDDPMIKGSARYKQGDFAGALEDFKPVASATARYNAGNAAFGLQDYQQAIDLYTEALVMQPDSKLEQDIKHNLELAHAMLEQTQPQDQQQQQNNQQQGESRQQQSQAQQQGESQQQQNQAQQQGESQQQQSQAQQQGESQQEQAQSASNPGADPTTDSDQGPEQVTTEQQSQPQGDASQDATLARQAEATQGEDASGDGQQLYGEAHSRGALLLNRVEDNPAELLQRMFWLQQQKKGGVPQNKEPKL